MDTRRLSAILSLDVVDYTQMMQANASKVVERLQAVYAEIITPAVKAHEGRVVKLMGDGALIEFRAATSALQAAIQIQSALFSSKYAVEGPLCVRLRIGLHAGDVTKVGTELFGDALNIASRLQSAARTGEIWTSRLLCDLAGATGAYTLRGEGLHSFKGVEKPIEVLSVHAFDKPQEASSERFRTQQTVQYAKTKDGVNLAWAAVGEGTPVVKAPSWIGHLELDWRNPGVSPICSAIAQTHQLIRFDGRLTGLSDWTADTCSFENFVDDLEAIYDAAKIERAPILAMSQGCAVAAAFAARRPERVSGILMIGGFPVGTAKRSSERETARATAMRQMFGASWDDDHLSLRHLMAEAMVPGASEEARQQFAKDMRQMISPENMVRYRDVVDFIDVIDVLPVVSAPCLVCHATDDRMQPAALGRQLAKELPNAFFASYSSPNHMMPSNDPEWPRLQAAALAFLAAHAR